MKSAVGNLPQAWHEFALLSWNDYQRGQKKQFHDWDQLEWGMKKAFETPFQSSPRPTEVKLDGFSSREIDLLQAATDGTLPRLSFQYDYLKFTDPDVRSVTFENVIATGGAMEFKVRALLKINGQWSEEDWSDFASGLHLGVAFGARALRARFLFPGVAFGASFERTFVAGDDPTSIKLGFRVAFDLDL